MNKIRATKMAADLSELHQQRVSLQEPDPREPQGAQQRLRLKLKNLMNGDDWLPQDYTPPTQSRQTAADRRIRTQAHDRQKAAWRIHNRIEMHEAAEQLAQRLACDKE